MFWYWCDGLKLWCEPSVDFLMWSETGHHEVSLNQKWSCLPPRRGSEREWEGVRGHWVTQVRDRRPRGPHLAYLRKCNGGGKSDKGQGFGCDKEGPDVLLWPRLSPWLSVARGPSRGRELTANQESSQECVSHTGMNLTLCCQIYRVPVCIYMW